MLERMLSKWGYRVYFGVVIALMAYVFWGTFTNAGLAGWLNEMQANVLAGRFFPSLTVVLLLIPVLAIAFPVGFLCDYLTGQGIYAPETPDAPDSAKNCREQVAVEYLSSSSAGFDAALAAVRKFGHPITVESRETGTIVYHALGQCGLRMTVPIVHTLSVKDLEDRHIEVLITTSSSSSLREGSQAIGQIISAIDKVLGVGAHIRGELIRTDPASELKRFLQVVIFFVIAISVAFLFIKWKNNP